jgi:hypothetical protein
MQVSVLVTAHKVDAQDRGLVIVRACALTSPTGGWMLN